MQVVAWVSPFANGSGAFISAEVQTKIALAKVSTTFWEMCNSWTFEALWKKRRILPLHLGPSFVWQGPSQGSWLKEKDSCGKSINTTSSSFNYKLVFECMFFLFVLVSLQLTSTPQQLGSGWGHRSISSTLTPAIPVYFRTICVFIYKRSWPEHAPVCRFHPLHPSHTELTQFTVSPGQFRNILFFSLFLYCFSSSLSHK